MMSHTMYAEDLILFPKSIAAAQRMLDDVQRVFASAGLRVNPDKCHYLFKEGRVARYRRSEVSESLKLNGVIVERHEQLIVLGNCIKVKKDSLSAFHHRQALGNSCFQKWWPVLRSKMLPLRRRVELFFAGPFLAATWHSETWTMNPEIAAIFYFLGNI